ncbi:hypothetical protein [Streptomyces arboris]|uniref:hypothetical protein n=1 Tax=Streptomyces arboris TaxID=2600619 RepID=UPI003BF5FBB9
MGACLTPTPTMAPWYNVEVSTSHAEITATTYLRGWYRVREEGGATDWRAATADAYTDEERAAAWITHGPATFSTPAAPVSALVAALRQIADHPAYARWQEAGGEPTPNGVRAELGADGRARLTGPFIRHPEDQDGDHLHSVEVLFSDIAPLLDALKPWPVLTGDGTEADPYVIDLGGAQHRPEECGCKPSPARGDIS